MLYSKGKILVGSKLEINIVFIEHIKEHTAEVFALLSARSDYPIILHNGRSRAVEAEIESYISSLCTIVSNYEIKLLVSRYRSDVEAEPFLASRYILASPVEVNRLSTSVINDILGLINFSRNSNFLVRLDSQENILYTQTHKILHIPAPRFVVLAGNRVIETLSSR